MRAPAVTGLGPALIKAAIFTLDGLLTLSVLGVSVTPLLAARGEICQVREFVDQYLAQHELRKRIFRRFRDEGIEIPFPQRVVHLQDGDGRRPAPVAAGEGAGKEEAS